mmetsp:Transcript_32732/g.79474  ORF Transcript_32732/g.79474 Transcript_32732/m.79474 type:complete len:278 (+) Transcript_32732:2344-3177(+)
MAHRLTFEGDDHFAARSAVRLLEASHRVAGANLAWMAALHVRTARQCTARRLTSFLLVREPEGRCVRVTRTAQRKRVAEKALRIKVPDELVPSCQPRIGTIDQLPRAALEPVGVADEDEGALGARSGDDQPVSHLEVSNGLPAATGRVRLGARAHERADDDLVLVALELVDRDDVQPRGGRRPRCGLCGLSDLHALCALGARPAVGCVRRGGQTRSRLHKLPYPADLLRVCRDDCDALQRVALGREPVEEAHDHQRLPLVLHRALCLLRVRVRPEEH